MNEKSEIDESKFDILSHLPKEFTLDFALIASGDIDGRLAALHNHMQTKHWHFPLIFKPDNGYRGASVKLIRTLEGGFPLWTNLGFPVEMGSC